MNKIILIISTLLISNIALADTHGKSTAAHVHGTIKIEMAVEDKKINIDIDGPAESFVGFEYKAKSKAEKKAWANAENLWKKDLITKLFVLDKGLGCVVTKATFEQEVDEKHETKNSKGKQEAGVHSDIEAKAEITCAKDMAGQVLIVAIKKHFPNIHKLAVELISTETKTIEIKSNEQLIKL